MTENEMRLKMLQALDCVYCGHSTIFGLGRFVNRIPVFGTHEDPDMEGYSCAECMAFDCDRCREKIPLDEDILLKDGDTRVHPECCTKKELKEAMEEWEN